MLDAGPEFFRVNDVVVHFQKLKLLPEGFQKYQISVQKGVPARMIGRNNAMIVHNRVAAGRMNVIEPSGAM